MFKHNEKRKLPYQAELLFAIVLDIEAYPQFLPWCKAARIKSDDGKIIIADLIVGAKGISEKFTSKVAYDKKNYKIITEYIDGPLELMQSHWYFKQRQKNCDLDFSVEFSFRHSWLQKAFQKLFEHATLNMMQAFENRAETLKG